MTRTAGVFVPESLERLALCASVRCWVAAARPGVILAPHAAAAAYNIIHVHAWTEGQSGQTWENHMQAKHNEAVRLINNLEKESREFFTPADDLPLPLALRRCWDTTARAFLTELTRWMMYLYRIYLLQDASFQFVQLFLWCAEMNSTGGVARDVTLLVMLEQSMFHAGVSASLLKGVGLGAAQVRRAAERVLARLNCAMSPHAKVVARRVNTALRIQYN